MQDSAIPVYHAHATVRDGILSGAMGGDPAVYGFDADRTLEASFAGDLAEFQGRNNVWFHAIW